MASIVRMVLAAGQELYQPGATPNTQVGTEPRGLFEGWVVLTSIVNPDTRVISLRDFRVAESLNGNGVATLNTVADSILSWRDSENPDVIGTIDAITINGSKLGGVDPHFIPLYEARIAFKSKAGGIDQQVRPGFGAINAQPYDYSSFNTNNIAAAQGPYSLGQHAPLYRGTLPRPIVADYSGSAFTMEIDADFAAALSGGTSGTLVLCMHGKWGTKGSGTRTETVDSCRTENAGTSQADSVAQSVIKTATLLG